MVSVRVVFLLCQLFLLLTALAAPPASSVYLPGCPENCGNIIIPYPFGIGAGCYREGFGLMCNQSFTPPKLFILSGYGTPVELISIPFEQGLVSIQTNVNQFLYSDMIYYNFSLSSLGDGPYTFSERYHQFTAIGCRIIASLITEGVVSICASICTSTKRLRSADGRSCSGIGCCQTSIPGGIKSLQIRIQDLRNGSGNTNSTIAQAFVREKDWYTFNASDLSFLGSKMKVPELPVVLEWAVDKVPCEVAKRNATTFACRSRNSYCSNSTNVVGYLCSCSDGFQGNPYLPAGCQDVNECEKPKEYPCFGICQNVPGYYICVPIKSKDAVLVGLLIGVGIGAGLLMLLASGTLSYRKLKKRNVTVLKKKFFRLNRGLLLQQLISSSKDIAERTKIFSLEELEKATNNFDKSRILGSGGHGTVYKGILSDQRVVAIKRSKITIQTEIDQFINEVAILSQINHRNVVKLFGCCLETQVPLLVYEFISNGNLFEHLHGRDQTLLSWEDRLRIGTETARAISYLHSAASISVFHRDVKTSNILLDDNCTAKLSDFGASRTVALDQTRITTLVQGTFGYLDPEYFHTSQLTQKSDVYSFGVILVELLTGKKPISNRSHEEKNLINQFICFLRSNGLIQALEPRVVEEGPMEEVETVARLAETCLRLKGEERPTMKEVEIKLEALRRSKNQKQQARVTSHREQIEGLSVQQFISSNQSDDTTRQYSLEKDFMLSFPR